MKNTSKEIRKNNLKILIKQAVTQRAFADICALAPAHVSQMVTGNRSMGDEVARRIEGSLGLDRGWMDKSDSIPPNTETVSKEDMLYMRMLSKLSDESKKEIYSLIDREYSKAKTRDLFK